jgi:hypothetical protein
MLEGGAPRPGRRPGVGNVTVRSRTLPYWSPRGSQSLTTIIVGGHVTPTGNRDACKGPSMQDVISR